MSKKIPTVVGLIILVAGLVAGVILVNSRTSLQTKAGPTESPKNIKVSNRGTSGFSVSWTTDIPMTGYLKYSEDPAKINLPAGDVRDQISGTSQGYTNHYVNVTGLGANKTYYFLIGSGSKIYNDNDKPYQVRSIGPTSSPPEDVISGKIVNVDATPVNGALLFLDLEGAESLSTISKADGTWRINLSSARSKDGKVVTVDPQKTLLSIFVQAGIAGTATAITNTSKAKPVPDILIGKNQSFVESSVVISDLPSATRGGSFALTESQLASEPVVEKVSLLTFLNPAIDGELIATTSPEFKIKMATGSSIFMKVGDQASGNLKENELKELTWSPLMPLTPGINTLLVQYQDEKGVLQKVSRDFNVLSIGDASGIPAFTATPSATPTLAEITPTPTEVTTMPETDSENLSDSGTVEQTIFFGVFGLILVMAGSYLKKKWH